MICCRHSLACFLTRGDLWVSWTKGAQVFDEFLLDYDYSLNAANWMWLSCSAFFNAYFRCYSPVAFARKWDPNGAFIRHYLPTLRNIPDKYIHEPWKAPKAIQAAANCIIGKDYPKPIVDHSIAAKENIAKMRIAFQKASASKKTTPQSIPRATSRKRGRDSNSERTQSNTNKRRR